jgi:hypothetical protein
LAPVWSAPSGDSRNYDSAQLSPTECAQSLLEETSPATITFIFNLGQNEWHYVVDKLSRNLFNLRDDNAADTKFIHVSDRLSSFYVLLKCNEVKSC